MPITPPSSTSAPPSPPSSHADLLSSPAYLVLASVQGPHAHPYTQGHGHTLAGGQPVHVAALEALAEHIAHKLAMRLRGPEPWLTKREIADAFRVTPAQIDRLVREGMPRLYVGAQSPRFEMGACRAWLERRSAMLVVAPASDEPSVSEAFSVSGATASPVSPGALRPDQPRVPGVRCLSRPKKR